MPPEIIASDTPMGEMLLALRLKDAGGFPPGSDLEEGATSVHPWSVGGEVRVLPRADVDAQSTLMKMMVPAAGKKLQGRDRA